ncbi:hypothetical protein SFC15_18805 [Shouchella clausii]
MASKKPLTKAGHFHIPADPLRTRLEEIRSKHSERRVSSLKTAEVTNEMLYELLTDILEHQVMLEAKLQARFK